MGISSEMRERIAKTIENLRKNNIKAFFVEKKEDVVPLIEKMLNKGDTVAVGGSMTLLETGVIEHLGSGRYNFLDRYKPGLTKEQIHRIYIDSFSADAYLCSSNAVTERGELFNVDGTSNRVAAIVFGPKSVIMVVGYKKIVENIEKAVERVKTVAAPANCERLNCETFCREKGRCMSLELDAPFISDGCNSPDRICCNYVISAKQRINGRIKVIIVGEELGY